MTLGLGHLRGIVTKPISVAANLANRPIRITAHNSPVYVSSALDRLQGAGPLEKAVAGKVVMILVARGADKLEEAKAEIEAAGGVAHVYPCDLTDLDAIDALALKVLADHGVVDILVNNAGRSIRRSIELSYDRFHDFERTMQLNYFAALRLILRFLPVMRAQKSGQIINISSIGVQTRVPRFSGYIASKAALDTWSDAVQAEVHEDNVRFTTIHMPLVRTPMIAPTKTYDKFPVLNTDQAAQTIADAVIHRPRRLSPAFGSMAALADALSPQLMDIVRNRGFRMFPDSHAAKGEPSTDVPAADEQVSAAGVAFARATRGVHW
jgi:short-subunit dehydrogenase